MNKIIVALAVFVITVVALSPIIYFLGAYTEPAHVEVNFTWSTLEANVTQGSAVTINCTIFNTDYNNSINEGFDTQLAGINNVSYWENSTLAQQFFNATFAPNPLLLQPREAKTTFLTINIASDAPLGSYTFALQGNHNWLNLAVLPKQTIKNQTIVN